MHWQSQQERLSTNRAILTRNIDVSIAENVEERLRFDWTVHLQINRKKMLNERSQVDRVLKSSQKSRRKINLLDN